MSFVNTSSLPVIERLPGWKGRYFHSPNMTFAHYDFTHGSSIHQHSHAGEEVYEVIEGELEVTIDGVAQIARPGLVAIVPSNVRHANLGSSVVTFHRPWLALHSELDMSSRITSRMECRPARSACIPGIEACPE